jgi:hypothetical protein
MLGGAGVVAASPVMVHAGEPSTPHPTPVADNMNDEFWRRFRIGKSAQVKNMNGKTLRAQEAGCRYILAS